MEKSPASPASPARMAWRLKAQPTKMIRPHKICKSVAAAQGALASASNTLQAGALPFAHRILLRREEDDQDDPDATQKGQQAGGTGEGPGAEATDTAQDQGARGPQPSTTQAAAPEAAPAPDPTAAFKKE